MMAGQAKSLAKLFHKVAGLPVQTFVIFTPGGIDFVGGYCYYQFLKNNILRGPSQIDDKLGKLNLNDLTGEGIHEKLFVARELKSPAYWRQIVAYF